MQLIQGHSGVKVNILGGDLMRRCEEKSLHEHLSNSEWLSGQSCLDLQIQKQCEW